MNYHFFATLSRMKYIERWALMRNARHETLSEHALEVAMIAHGLCIIGNTRYGRHLNAEKAALVALYHDASEIITGDMPTPVKYRSSKIRNAYKEVEAAADEQLLTLLPEDLRPAYEAIFEPYGDPDEMYMRMLVKAADKISALIKCIEEARAGNTEFSTAAESTQSAIDKLCKESPEVRDFVKDFLPSYGRTLDELLG